MGHSASRRLGSCLALGSVDISFLIRWGLFGTIMNDGCNDNHEDYDDGMIKIILKSIILRW